MAQKPEPNQAHAVVIGDALRAEKGDVAHILRPRAVLGEILALCTSVIAGAEPCRPKDRRSLIDDATKALGALGKNVKRTLQPAISDYQSKELQQLSALLDERGGTQRLQHATNALNQRLLSTSVAVAAWQDLVQAAVDGRDKERCRLHALQLRELDEARGHEWIWRRSRFLELIGAGAFEDCEEVVGQPPSRTAQIVWLVFGRAGIASVGPQRVGQVQFLSEQLIPTANGVEGSSVGALEPPFAPELDEDGLIWLEVDEDVEGPLVYARVELTGSHASGSANPWAQGMPPALWARGLVDGIVKAATFRLGGSAWQLLDGEAVYHGTLSDESGAHGNWSGATPFGDPLIAKRRREFIEPQRERTGTALEELDPGFVGHLAAGKREAAAAVQEVRWFESAEEQVEIGQRLMLHLGAFLRIAPDALSLLKADGDARLIARQLRSITGWEKDPTAVHRCIDRLANHFDMLLARALRQRNSIVHGLDSHQAVIASVDGFISRLAAMVVAQAVHGAAVDENLVEALALGRDRNRRTLWRLRNGEQPVSRVLYSEPSD